MTPPHHPHPHPPSHPRPLHRWKSFWLGIFVACFLSWSWWDSYRHDDRLIISANQCVFWFFHEEGSTLFAAFQHSAHPEWEIHSQRKPRKPGDPSPREILKLFKDPGITIEIRDFAVLLTFLVSWAGALAWRYRKQQRLHRLTESESDSPPPSATA